MPDTCPERVWSLPADQEKRCQRRKGHYGCHVHGLGTFALMALDGPPPLPARGECAGCHLEAELVGPPSQRLCEYCDLLRQLPPKENLTRSRQALEARRPSAASRRPVTFARFTTMIIVIYLVLVLLQLTGALS